MKETYFGPQQTFLHYSATDTHFKMESTLTWQLLKLYALKYMANRHRRTYTYASMGNLLSACAYQPSNAVTATFSCILFGVEASACAKRMRVCAINNKCLCGTVCWNVLCTCGT